MRYSRQQHLTAFASLLGALFITFLGQYKPGSMTGTLHSVWGNALAQASNLAVKEQVQDALEYRIAGRLQNRLRKKNRIAPPISAIAHAVAERQSLLKKATTVSVLNADGTTLNEWQVSTQRYPLWIIGEFTLQTAAFNLDRQSIVQTLQHEIDPLVVKPTNASIEEILPEEGILKIKANVARSGQDLDIQQAADQVEYALRENVRQTALTLQPQDGSITNLTHLSLGDMKLLASGKSNFKGSTWARSFNVRKALREHVNNTLVPPGETFSFNSTLGGPVSLGNGWAMAKIIVNGADLEQAPGGGICQASTTVYRAVLNAGFPVTERRAHSLYVSYYKEYGVGIDATIYPGSQDLVFTNDTGNYLLIQAYDDGYDAVVNIYGTGDGRKVALEGPFFTVNAPSDLRINGRAITQNEIAWLHTVWYPDGREVKNTIVSRYKTLPNYVRNEYAYAQ